MIEEALRMLREHLEDEQTHMKAGLLDVKLKEIDKLTRKRENLINMRLEGEIDKDMFISKRKEIEDNLEILAEEVKKLSPDSADKAKTVEERLADLKEQIQKYTDFQGMQIIPETVVEAFTRKIIVNEDSFDWFLRFNKMIKEPSTKSKSKTSEEYTPALSFTLTLEDAKKYVYSFSSTRRVHGWKDITINLWI